MGPNYSGRGTNRSWGVLLRKGKGRERGERERKYRVASWEGRGREGGRNRELERAKDVERSREPRTGGREEEEKEGVG